MVEVKVESEEIIFRLLYLGSPSSTRFANLRAIHESLPAACRSDLAVLHAGRDRIVRFRHRPEDGSKVFGLGVAIDVLTMPGTPLGGANLKLLADAADAVVWLDDRAPTGDGEDAAFLELLGGLDALGRRPDELPIVVQCYQDTPDRRAAGYRAPSRSAWKPHVARIPDLPDAPRRVYDEVRERLLEVFRGIELELDRDGFDGHLRIRDRLYEKITRSGPARAGEARDAARSAFHLEPRDGGVRRGRARLGAMGLGRRLLWIALPVVAALAWALARAL